MTRGVSFDLFGTLVTADRPADPAAAVARELRERGVAVPDDWSAAYAEAHVEVSPGRELSLTDHVLAALRSRGRSPPDDGVRTAVLAAFDREVRPREGATAAVAAAADAGPVGVLSNCSVPGLVDRALSTAGIDAATFDAVLASVDIGWRKPSPEAFEAVAAALGVPPSSLVHVGDDPDTDGGASRVGARPVLVEERPLTELPIPGGP